MKLFFSTIVLAFSPIALSSPCFSIGTKPSDLFRLSSPTHLTDDPIEEILKARHKIARAMAIEFHRDQLYGDHVYEYHLHKVRSVLKRFGFGQNSRIGLMLGTAAWLHDIIEDTPITFATLENLFGTEIADTVRCVSNDRTEGLSKMELKERTFLLTSTNPLAIILKLADRIANMEESLKNFEQGKDNRLQKYVDEWPLFSRILRPKGGPEKMWRHLNRLTSVAKSRLASAP